MEFKLDTVFNGDTPKGYCYSANNFNVAEHGGTHDALLHFYKKGQSVDEIPIEKLIGKAVKIDISSKTNTKPDYLVSAEELLDWEKHEKTNIPKGSIILFQTGYFKYYPHKIKYLGTSDRGEKAVNELHFPGLSPVAAKWLVEHHNINAIGIDTLRSITGNQRTLKVM